MNRKPLQRRYGRLITGLAAVRHSLLMRAGWNVEEDGLFGSPPLTVIVGGEAHVAVFKALSMLGLGRNRVHRVPADGQGRMRVDALPALDENAIVCIQAGSVNTGAWVTDAHRWPNTNYDCGIAFLRDPDPSGPP